MPALGDAPLRLAAKTVPDGQSFKNVPNDWVGYVALRCYSIGFWWLLSHLPAQNNYWHSFDTENNAQKIVQEDAAHFLMRRASSDVASSWLDIGQFWGNLAKSLTDADLDVDE